MIDSPFLGVLAQAISVCEKIAATPDSDKEGHAKLHKEMCTLMPTLRAEWNKAEELLFPSGHWPVPQSRSPAETVAFREVHEYITEALDRKKSMPNVNVDADLHEKVLEILLPLL